MSRSLRDVVELRSVVNILNETIFIGEFLRVYENFRFPWGRQENLK